MIQSLDRGLCILEILAFGAASGNLSTWSMLTDTFEVDELITGKRHEGIYSGFTTFMRKAASGLAILILGFGLEAAGFDQNEYTLLKTVDSVTGSFDAAVYATSATVSAIRILFVAVPAVLLSVTVFLATRYKLDARRYDLVRQAIERFKTGEDEFTEAETRDLELVTGRKAASFWGRRQ
jgi:Na+/melibiose symporter-like transporter